MPDLQVVYDPSLQMAAIVDLDTNMGFGPICAGPDGGNLLQSFIDGMPFDITILSPEQARDIFLSVFREQAAESIKAAGQDATPNLDTATNPPTDAEALATAEAKSAAGAPPEPAPADTDMAANQSQTDPVTPDPTSQPTATDTGTAGTPAQEATTTTTNCLVCNADGTGSKNPACPVCGGSGQVNVS